MSHEPLELPIELQPRSRFDAIDMRARVTAVHGDVLKYFDRSLYCSFHTTAGYLEQGLVSRLAKGRQGVSGYLDPFLAVFPEGAGYRHDELDERQDLSDDQRQVEPRNADSHLAFMAAGLRPCVTYLNHRQTPVPFVDLDGVNGSQARLRRTSVVAYNSEVEVWRTQVGVPVSGHSVDSINLRDPNLGLYALAIDAIRRAGVSKGRVRIELAHGERQAGLTVNEYETLLMRHDLREVLADPLRFMAEKGRHALRHPRSIPRKTRDYAAYDAVVALNKLVEALGLSESWVERLVARLMALPAENFFRMKRSVSLLVSDSATPGQPTVVEGTYQSPILVQWHRSPAKVRHLDLSLTQFT
jgi:thiamine phosphate synthase YjbQ (UPF0047 family)